MGTIAFRKLRQVWADDSEPGDDDVLDEVRVGLSPGGEAEVRLRLLDERINSLLHCLDRAAALENAENHGDPLYDPVAAERVGVSEGAGIAASTDRGQQASFEAPHGIRWVLYRDPPVPDGPRGPGIVLDARPHGANLHKNHMDAYQQEVRYLPAVYAPASVPALRSEWELLRRSTLESLLRRASSEECANERGGNDGQSVYESSSNEEGSVETEGSVDTGAASACDQCHTVNTSVPFVRTPSDQAAPDGLTPVKRVLDAYPFLGDILAGIGVLLGIAGLALLLQELLFWF